jgi:inorganic pyrophosphatase
MTADNPGPYAKLPPFDEKSGDLNAVIETPKGSRSKFDYEPERGLFVLHGVLPAGAVFPFDFGFVPGTMGGDGDPLDVLVIGDEPTFTGCLLTARLVGVIEAEQRERDGVVQRNDRLIAVASVSRDNSNIQSLDDLSDPLLEELEHFFVSYNQIKGKEFTVLSRSGPDRAREIVEGGAASS